MMTENRKFILSKEPFIRKADHKESTSVLMRDFVIALVPLIIFAGLRMDLCPFLMVILISLVYYILCY